MSMTNKEACAKARNWMIFRLRGARTSVRIDTQAFPEGNPELARALDIADKALLEAIAIMQKDKHAKN